MYLNDGDGAFVVIIYSYRKNIRHLLRFFEQANAIEGTIFTGCSFGVWNIYPVFPIGTNKLIFLAHKVLWNRDANCSSTAHEGRNGRTSPLPTVSKEARSFSDWIVRIFSKKSSIAALCAEAMFKLASKECKVGLSTLVWFRSVGGGNLINPHGDLHCVMQFPLFVYFE